MLFHREKRIYSIPAGELNPEAINEIANYLSDIIKGNTKPVPSVNEMTVALKNAESYQRWSPGRIGDRWDIASDLMECFGYDLSGFKLGAPNNIRADNSTQQDQNASLAIRRWHRFLTDRTPGIKTDWTPNIADLEPLGMAWTTSGSGTYVGTYPKRLSKYLWHTFRVRLKPFHLETIGNIGSAYLAKNTEYRLTFDRDYLDGSAEDYCYAGSCYWGCHESARYTLYENGGYAIRAWSGGEPIARCWIAEHDDGCLLFNAYGDLSLMEFARVLSHNYGMSYRKCRLTHDGGWQGDFWINEGDSVILAQADIINELEEYPKIDLRWDVVHRASCRDCECSIDPDESYSDPDGRTICESCYCDNYSSCGRCGDVFQHDDVYDCDGDYYCESCAERKGFGQCHDCNEWHSGLSETEGGHHVCESCADDYTACCDCDTLARETQERTDGEHVCDDCSDSYVKCEECGLLADETSADIHGAQVCESCARSMDRCTDCDKLAPSVDDTANGHSVCEHCRENYRECEDCGELIPPEPTLFPICCGETVTAA